MPHTLLSLRGPGVSLGYIPRLPLWNGTLYVVYYLKTTWNPDRIDLTSGHKKMDSSFSSRACSNATPETARAVCISPHITSRGFVYIRLLTCRFGSDRYLDFLKAYSLPQVGRQLSILYNITGRYIYINNFGPLVEWKRVPLLKLPRTEYGAKTKGRSIVRCTEYLSQVSWVSVGFGW